MQLSHALFQRIAVLAISIIVSCSGPPIFAQEQLESELTSKELKRKVQQLESELKNAKNSDELLANSLKSTLTVVDDVAAKESELLELQSDIQSAESRAKEFQDSLKTLKSRDVDPVDLNIESSQLNSEILRIKSEVESLKSKLKSNAQAEQLRLDRRKNSQEQLASLTKKVSDLFERVKKAEAKNTTLKDRVNITKQQAELALAKLQKAVFQAQVQRDDAESTHGLLRYQGDVLELQLKQNEELLSQLELLQRSRFELSTKRLADSAKREQIQIAQSTPLLLPSYEINSKIAQRAYEVEKKVSEAKQNADRLKSKVNDLKKKFQETTNQVNSIGLTASVGALLRKRRSELLDSTLANPTPGDIASQIDEIQFEIFDIDQQIEELSKQQIRSEIENSGGQQSNQVWESLDPKLDAVIKKREEQLVTLKNSLNRLFNQLVDIQQFDSVQKSTTFKFRDYINERILWIRSNDVLFSKLSIDSSDLTVFDYQQWQIVGREVLQVFGFYTKQSDQKNLETNSQVAEASPLRLTLTFISSLFCFFLLLAKPRMLRQVDRFGNEAARGNCTSFWPTGHALVLTILIAFVMPILPILLGVSMVFAPFRGSVLFYAIGYSLFNVGLFALPIEILRQMCRPQGIANKHFSWNNKSVEKLKQNLDRVVLPGSLLVASVTLLYRLDMVHRVDMVERIFFIGGMVLAIQFLYSTLNAKNGIFCFYLRANEKSWANQTVVLWLGFILLIPFSLAVLTVLGYYYTALNLSFYAYSTFVFALVVETIRGFAQRFVLVRRRNALIQAARRRRQAQLEAQRQREADEQKVDGVRTDQENLEQSDSLAESIEAQAEIQPEEIEDNVRQAYKLISLSLMIVWVVGIWMIWIDVLPALRTLDNYELWTNESVEAKPLGDSDKANSDGAKPDKAVAAPSDAGISSSAIEKKANQEKYRVTVRDLLLFLVIAVITWVAATNLPNAFEILFLEQLPVDRSFRYAIKALSSYAIILFGAIFAFRSLSIGWSNVQWLATALTFGLAFGLQEIFANFVAGIILMFERPVRIGDLITVDQYTGIVSKIRTRATTIVSWDRKEYVIPNKDFITGRLVNWTLSDAINRLELTIGIAYGSDVELAKSTLWKICENHPKIVSDPPPQVVFKEFGDSALNIELKCFISDVDSRLQVLDSLHTQINQAFIEAEIEISFPQRDLHLRTVDAEVINVLKKQKTDK